MPRQLHYPVAITAHAIVIPVRHAHCPYETCEDAGNCSHKNGECTQRCYTTEFECYVYVKGLSTFDFRTCNGIAPARLSKLSLSTIYNVEVYCMRFYKVTWLREEFLLKYYFWWALRSYDLVFNSKFIYKFLPSICVYAVNAAKRKKNLFGVRAVT